MGYISWSHIYNNISRHEELLVIHYEIGTNLRLKSNIYINDGDWSQKTQIFETFPGMKNYY